MRSWICKSHAKLIVVQPIAELLRDPEFLPRHELILVSGPMKRSSLNSLCKTAWGLGTPVIYTHSVGFYSTLSVQLPAEFPIVETHPDPEATEDLRLLNPWPELRAAASCISNLDSLDDHQHGHIPYVLLLLHYLEKWKETHNDTLPSNYKEKSEFKDLVRANERTTNPEGGEENFEEAAAAVLKSLNPFTLRSSIREIFEMDECKNLKQESTDFWIIAAAVKEFYQKHNELPLPGSLPDMKAQSENYLSLQNIYKAKARRDLEDVTRTVRQLEAQLSREVPVPEKDIEVFCKNAAHIKLVRGREIPNLDGDAHTVRTIRSHLADSESLMAIFFATRVLDIVVSEIQNGERDGSALDDEDTWIAHIDAAVNNLAQGDRTAIDDEARARIIAAVQELRRTEGGELHNTSALTGGLVAQEALKVLTRQYVPLDNTCIFDGVRSRSEMFRL